MNLGWLLLGLGLGPLSQRYGGWELPEAGCCLFESIEDVVKPEPRPAIHVEKQLGWVHKLGGTGPQGISKERQTVLARLMESQI